MLEGSKLALRLQKRRPSVRAIVAMPLDTGAVTDSLVRSAVVDISDVGDRSGAAPEGALDIGAYLRATRVRLGRSIQDISSATRIKRSYLEAVEELRLED